MENSGKSENFRGSDKNRKDQGTRGIREIRGDSENRRKALYVEKSENLSETRRIPGIRSLGDSEDREIPEIGRLQDLGNRGIGENLFAWQK